MKKSTILVTGAGGYIGSVATYLLLREGYQVVGLDNFKNGYEQPLKLLQKKFGKPKLTYYKKDLLKPLDSIFKKHNFDAVLHYAALCKVSESMEQPEMYFSNNVCGTQNLLTAMFKYKVSKLVFSSTCAVYAPAEYLPVDDKHPTGPESPYGESKLLVEKILRWYAELGKLNYLSLRYFNVCGASDDGLIGDSKKPSTLLFQSAVRGALDIEPFYLTYKEVDTPDGSPVRDYINVVDLNEAHLLALDYLFNGGKSETVNLGTGKGNSVLEIVNTVQKTLGVSFKAERDKPRKGEATKIFADTQKAKKLLGWVPTRSIQDSINSLVKWYKKQPQGWRF